MNGDTVIVNGVEVQGTTVDRSDEVFENVTVDNGYGTETPGDVTVKVGNIEGEDGLDVDLWNENVGNTPKTTVETGGIFASNSDGISVRSTGNSETVISTAGMVNATENGLSVLAGHVFGDEQIIPGGTVRVTVDGDITAGEGYSLSGDYEYPYSGISIGNIKGDVSADVKGNVSGTIGMYMENSGTTLVTVDGDVTGTGFEDEFSDIPGVGIAAESNENLDVFVSGTVKGNPENGVGVFTSDNGDNFKLTVWKIEPTVEGSPVGPGVVAAMYIDDTYDGVPRENVEFEKKINYIIKVDTNVAGATLSASDETQNEGKKVYLRINLQDGYEITGAYDDNGIYGKNVLQKDENGYYVIVPRGGGVYLTVTVGSAAKTKILNPQTTDGESSGNNNANGASLCASIAQMIMDAAQGATVRVTITKGTSLCKMAVDALEARKDVTLVVDYAVNDGMYEATIPAGTDLAQYKNAVGGIDFETLTVHFGGKQIF